MLAIKKVVTLTVALIETVPDRFLGKTRINE